MKDLGVRVLTRIQKLISEIDKPQPSSPKRKVLTIEADQNVSFGGSPQQIPQEDKARLFTRMSYSYVTKKEKINTNLLNRVYDQQQSSYKYKITNKKTRQILQKKPVKPIYERVDQILQKKQKYVQDFKKYYHKKQDESMRSAIAHKYSFNKFNQQDLYYYCNEIDDRNRQRIQRKHFNKLPFVKKQDQYHKIPVVDQVSRSLSERRNLRKKYSENVFKRMSQYIQQEGERKIERVRKRTQEQGGFTPAIDPRSRIIANKLKIKRSPNTRLIQAQACKHYQKAKDIKNQRNQKRIVSRSKSLSKETIRIDKRQQKRILPAKATDLKQAKTDRSKQNNKSGIEATVSKKESMNPSARKQFKIWPLNENNSNSNISNKNSNKK